ncbi:SDR family NAD(P)-dependent oxidoreductase [Dyella psychrodurans]|uniref:SDR family NAD(P)-dependent oxidoreductase n=1 Tax=Dyella psychrodurans TaxID=1927960 RepID=A0A370X082_9GAMM|nr:glucose 1-dehydrogenase [Dyella psychrodurans]RDS81809.1 SDR family NAD(P)-dependent oxidoreductase [Dyella psychrodurans]
MAKLDGKVAVITGGSSGIGLATAKAFVDEGAYVFITGRRQSELDNAKAAIGRNVSTVQGDVAKLEDLDRLFAQVKAEKGGLDVLVVNAGFVEMAPLAAVTPEHFDKTFAVNARGAFFSVQKAAPLMRDGGSIVLVSSGVHMKGIPQYHTYGATKAAMRFWARSLAAELKSRGIRVNTLSPGATETPIFYGQFKSREEANVRKGMFEQMTPLGRMGRPEEMAKAILFLGSNDSSYTTGSDLVADGGLTQV